MRNNFKLALISIAIGFTFAGTASAKELVIPTLPSAQKAKAVEMQPQPTEIDVAEYGVQVEDTAASGPASNPDTSYIEVVGGGRDGDLPEVPAGVAKGAPLEAVPEVSSFQEVVVQPGVNTIIPAAVNHLNRIVTPFEKPIVQTVSSAQIHVKENVIYVSTENESPVTMYITPKEDESVAISLTLAPRKVPPIQASLILGDAMSTSGQALSSGGRSGRGFHYSGQAKKWEEGQPYMEAIKGIMRSLALEQIPKGYSIGKAGRHDSIPACQQSGITYDFSAGQIIMGHNFKVVVGIARNTAAQPQMIDETSCTHPTLAGTAAWPRNMLEPGQDTEIYVITRVGEAPAEESSRPSLLN
jgi:conjugal transfer pilus assembly protein TraK